MADVAIVGGPECNQDGRVGRGVVLDGDVCDLIVTREMETWLGERSHKALVVVGRGVEKMAEQLEIGPFAFAARGVPVGRGEGGEDRFGLGHEIQKVSGHLGQHRDSEILA